MRCSLCNMDMRKEVIYFEDPAFVIVRTLNLKGHKDRIMIVYKKHEHTISNSEFEYALDKLIEVGTQVFNYTPKFVIMDSTFATINEHWHLVATDLDRLSDDYEQILKTKWLKVVDVSWGEI